MPVLMPINVVSNKEQRTCQIKVTQSSHGSIDGRRVFESSTLGLNWFGGWRCIAIAVRIASRLVIGSAVSRKSRTSQRAQVPSSFFVVV